MISNLHINIMALLDGNIIESSRIEFKKTWSEQTKLQVLHTICAFANDFQGLNGGYIILGVDAEKGFLNEVVGLEDSIIEVIQQEIRVALKGYLKPEYYPVFSPEEYNGKKLLVIWAPPSEDGPHTFPKEIKSEVKSNYYFVRIGSETCQATREQEIQLKNMLTNKPFEDRRNNDSSVKDISPTLVRNFLDDVKSKIDKNLDDLEIFNKMRIISKVNSHYLPKNIALILFSNNPEEWFPGAYIEVAQYDTGTSGNLIEVKEFKGPLQQQITACLKYFESFTQEHLTKIPNAPEVKGWISYPYQAFEESIINAVYHRDYQNYNPTKIHLHPDRIEIISYPGPVPSLNHEHFKANINIPPIPPRNKVLGDFLKELHLAERRGTGIPKVFKSMKENGSPEPIYDFDEARTYFMVTLPAHPEYLAISVLRSFAHQEAIGEREKAIRYLENQYYSSPSSGILAAKLIEEYTKDNNLEGSEAIFNNFLKQQFTRFKTRVIFSMVEAYIALDKNSKAKQLLESYKDIFDDAEFIEKAILFKRAGDYQKAHQLFAKIGNNIYQDARALHELAQTKLYIASDAFKRSDETTAKKMELEAEELLIRVIHMDASPTRHAWAWYDLGRVRFWLKKPKSMIIEAYENALKLLPNYKFKRALDNLEKNNFRQ